MKCKLIWINREGSELYGVEYPSVRKAKKSGEEAIKKRFAYKFKIVKYPKIKS